MVTTQRRRARTAPAPRKTRRDPRKQTTRARLLDAARDILLSEGAGGLTTGKIAAGAGIGQTGFYVHFKSIDECLQALADHVTRAVIDAEAELRRARILEPKPKKLLADSIERARQSLQACAENPRALELYLRCRCDVTPLGKGFRAAERRATALVVEDLWDLAISRGLRATDLRQLELIGELLHRVFVGALELLLLAPNPDLDSIARLLGTTQFQIVRAEIIRLEAEHSARGRTS